MYIDEDLIEFNFFKNKKIEEHSHRDIEIVFVLEGDLCLKIQNDRYEMHENDFVLINTFRDHAFFSEYDYLAVSFRINYFILSSMLQSRNITFLCNTVDEKNDTYLEIHRLLIRIVREYFHRDQPQVKVYLQSLYYMLIYRLVLDCSIYGDQDKELIIEKKEARLQEIDSYIQANYQFPFTLNEMAEQMHLSPGYLSKYICKNKNMRFTDYISSVRLFHATEDLLYTDKSITKIIYDNGFPNAATFHKQFQNKYQMTPSEYRAKMKADNKQGTKSTTMDEVSVSQIQTYLKKISFSQGLVNYNRENDFLLTAHQCERKKYTGNFEKVINIGSIEYLLDARVQEHVLILCRELGFTHVRIWSIFQDEMLYNSDAAAVKYNFTQMDEALDFLVKNKICAYLVLARKPKKIMYNTREQNISDSIDSFYYDEVSHDYQDDRFKFLPYLYQLAEHLVNRYGVSEIEKWFFEQEWLAGNNGKISEKYSEQEYYEIFTHFRKKMKFYSKNIRIGGFGTFLEGNVERIERVLRRMKEEKIEPDFISIHCFPDMFSRKMHGQINVEQNFPDERFIYHQIIRLRNLLKKVELGKCAIHVSEWGNTLSNRNNLNDSCLKGAYIMKNLFECQDKVQVMAYWYGSDLYGMSADSDSIIFGDAGLLTTTACRKPAFYGMLFVNLLYTNLLAQNSYAVITSDGHDRYRIACHNFCDDEYNNYLLGTNQKCGASPQKMFEECDMLTIQFMIQDVKNGRYYLRTQYVNQDNGSVQDELRRMGDLKKVGISDIQYLKNICAPHLQLAYIDVTDGILRVESTLRPNEIKLIELNYLHST